MIKNLGKIFIFGFLFTAACAPPSAEYDKQAFIPKKEVLADTLYQQGTDLFKGGRFIDSELKLRQALYLFPDADVIRASLALVLKSSEIYEEADNIYKDLIDKYPEAYDFQYDLADSYFRQKRFKEAEELYEKAMLGYEEADTPDMAKAAAAARSIASLAFLQGRELNAFCRSVDAVAYSTAAADQVARHVKILLALGYNDTAFDQVSPLIETPSDVKDPAQLKLAGIVYMSLNNVDQAKKFIELAQENQKAGLKDPDAELEEVDKILAYKYPDPPDPDDPDAEEEEEALREKLDKNLIFNELSLLYWPINLVSLYYEYVAANPDENNAI